MASQAERPNILVIMTDQHNRDFLGCYGHEWVRTPNLDRLAREGMRFTNAYCASPLCVPSRMSFLTSQTPSQNRVWGNVHVLSSGIPSWTHGMTIAGYETTLLGRMHFVGPDQRHGFEHRPVAEAGAGPLGIKWKGGPAWTRYSSETSGQCREAVEVAGRGPTHYQWSDEERTRVAVRWLRQKASVPATRPFAAVLGYVLPHCPFIAPKELFDHYFERVVIPEVEENQPATIHRFRKIRGLVDPPVSEERIRVALAAYCGLCEHIDALIGQVLDTLEETGLARDTLVIYTSDHGEMAGQHGCWWKSNYYEGSVCVPLIARWPGVTDPGTVCPAIVNLMDLGPTFLEVAGSEFPYPVQGHSLLKALQSGSDPDLPDETFSEMVDSRGGVLLASRMIRSGPWKLWVYADEENLPPALFHLEDDPGELHDLGQDPAYAAIRESLLDRVREDWNPVEAVRLSGENSRYSRLLRQWGEAVGVDSPDAMVFPPAEYEKEVELL